MAGLLLDPLASLGPSRFGFLSVQVATRWMVLMVPLSLDQISGLCSSLASSPCTLLPDSPQPCRLSVNEAGLGWLPRCTVAAVAAGFYQ